MERLTRLDGLRGVLAVYVMIGHALPYIPCPFWLAWLFGHGEAAVDLFFALSGLVISQSLERCNYRVGPFLVGRARRLLPVYFAVLALAVWLIWCGSPLPFMPWIAAGSNSWDFWGLGLPAQFGWHLLAHIILVHGLLPQGVLPWAYITLLGPAWSLSTEWQFYLLLALLLPKIRRLDLLAYGMLAAGIFYQAMAVHLPPGWQFSRAFLPDAAPFFALGLATNIWLRQRLLWPLLLVAALTAVLEILVGGIGKCLTPAAWLLAAAAQDNPELALLPRLFARLLARLLDSKCAQFLGTVSYPLYLLNAPLQRLAAMLVAPLAHGHAGWFTAIWLPLALALPVLAAYGLHEGLEKPFNRPLSRLSVIRL